MLKNWRGPILAVAMVWFTTHFGGGFASGRQLIEFYVQFGSTTILFPLLSQALTALLFYYTLLYTIQYKTYDYGSWANTFYSPYEKVFSPIFEIRNILGMIVVAGVAISTASSTISEVTGIPYLILVILTSLIIFILTIYDVEFVLRIAGYFSIPIIIGLIILYGSNVFVNWNGIVNVTRTAGSPQGLWPAIWKTITYASYQAGVGTWVAVADVINTKEEAKRAAILGFLFNGFLLQLAAFGILGHYPDIISETVPVLYMITNGVGGKYMTYIITILIVIGAVSTAINVIFGGVRRIALVIAKDKPVARKHNILASLSLVLSSLILSLFGLIALVSKGYGFLGFTAFPLVILPLLVWGIKNSKKVFSKDVSRIKNN